MNAWLLWTLMSRQKDVTVLVGRLATMTGLAGSEMSMKLVPVERPRMAYSVPSDGSTQPQMSFMSPPPTSSLER